MSNTQRFIKYKVRLLMDNEYQVIKQEGVMEDWEDIIEFEDSVYQGSIADCNAWLQLNDEGYLT